MPYSVYNYIAPGELSEYIHTMASVTNSGLAAGFISDAERIIDAFAGPGAIFYPRLTGEFKAALASGATDVQASIFGRRRPNYWAAGGVYIKILSGAEASVIGQRRLVVASANPETITLASGFAVDVPAGTQFHYRQESAFPRLWNTNILGDPDMPFLLKAAVAAQVEYGIQFGSEAFGFGDADIATDERGGISSRTYGSGYSESVDVNRAAGLAVWIAPRARVLMRRLLNSTGLVRG